MTALLSSTDEPLAEERRPEFPRQGRRHHRTWYSLWLAGLCQLVRVAARNEPNASSRRLLLVACNSG